MSGEVVHQEYAHQHVSHQFEDLEQQNESYIVGMWTFLVTEIMFFGALFLALTVYHSMYGEDFNEAHKHLDVFWGGFNTVVLLTSSLIMVMAVRSAMLARRSQTLMFLGLTMIGAFIFLGVKSVEYKSKWDHHLIPGAGFHFKSVEEEDREARIEKAGGTISNEGAEAQGSVSRGHSSSDDLSGRSSGSSNAVSGTESTMTNHLRQDGKQLFFCFYFIMTGLHAIHIIIGIAIMGIIWCMYLWGHPNVQDYMTLEMTGLYWHFVDIVWIFLFPILYLLGGH